MKKSKFRNSQLRMRLEDDKVVIKPAPKESIKGGMRIRSEKLEKRYATTDLVEGQSEYPLPEGLKSSDVQEVWIRVYQKLDG